MEAAGGVMMHPHPILGPDLAYGVNRGHERGGGLLKQQEENNLIVVAFVNILSI